MLDARGRAVHLELEVLLHVLRGCAVGVGCLHDANLDGVGEAGEADLVAQKGGDERGDAVAIKKTENVVGVFEIEDDAVGVAIKGAAAVARAGLGSGRGTLVGLDEVGTAL